MSNSVEPGWSTFRRAKIPMFRNHQYSSAGAFCRSLYLFVQIVDFLCIEADAYHMLFYVCHLLASMGNAR